MSGAAAEAVRVRPFAAEDAEAMAAMVLAFNLEQSYARGVPPGAAALRDAFLGPEATGRLLVAEAGGAVAGYATLHTTYETEFAARGAYLGDLYVAPVHRRRGAGRALVAAAASLVRSEGGVFLWWTALPRNAAAHAFYRALGATDEPLRAFVVKEGAFEGLAAERAP